LPSKQEEPGTPALESFFGGLGMLKRYPRIIWGRFRNSYGTGLVRTANYYKRESQVITVSTYPNNRIKTRIEK